MRVDVSTIKNSLGAVKDLDETYDMHDLSISGRTFEFVEPIQLNLQITNSGVEYLVTGRILAKSLVECSRCLDKYIYPLNFEFYELIAKDELENDNFLDLSDLIYEHFVVELPMRTICKEDCQGLCQICGQNLNLEECGCDRHVSDPRLIKLKDFLHKD